MEKARNRRDNIKSICWLFGGCLGFLFLISLFIPITYGINDDVAMRDIASGVMSGNPDGHLIFVKYVLGMLLALFYQIFPGVDWYGCVWLGFFSLCMALLLYQWHKYCILKCRSFWHFIGMFLLVFMLVGLEHLVHFQFTIISAILAGTAIFLYNTMEGKSFLAVFLAWFAYCVRASVFWMAAPFAALIFLFREDSLKYKIRTLLVTVSGIVLISGVEHIAYSEKEWKDYLEYNEYRSRVYDYYWIPSYEENTEFYHSIGMEEYDVANLSRYSTYLIADIETGKMQEISDYAKTRWKEENPWGRRLRDGVKCAVKGFFNLENMFLNLLANGVLFYNLFYEMKKHKKSFFLNAGFLGMEGLFWLYLGYQGRLPERVGAGLFIIVLLSAWSVFYQEQGQEMTWKWKDSKIKAVFLILLIGMMFGRFRAIQHKQLECYQENQAGEELEDYFRSNMENVYFVPTYILSDFVANFRIFQEFSISNGLSLGGWSAFSPVRTKGLRHYGILDVDKAIVEKDNIYLVLPDISTKIEEHYRQKYRTVSWREYETIFIGGRELTVFQLRADGSIE